MSQNNQPGSGTPEGEHGSAGHNPYYGRVDDGSADLDAAAPQLRDEESQRVNRKALIFLAAIVVLVVLMGLMLLTKMRADDAPQAKAPREEKPFVPDAPSKIPAPPLPGDEQTAAAPPIPLEQPMAPLPPPVPMARQDDRPRGPSLMDRRISAAGGMVGGSAGSDGGDPAIAAAYARRDQMNQAQQQLQNRGVGANGEPAELQQAPTTLASYLRKPDTLLLRGAYLRCVLETHIVTDVPGFTSCVLTEPVYSVNGKRLLLPKGSKLSGTYGGAVNGPRVAVVWDRITTPTGLDVTMSSPGVDNLGGAGHPGDYNAHWASRIASSLMISLLADAFKYAAAENGPQTNTVTASGTIVSEPYESATARTMERLANRAADEAMNRPPTVTINQGTVLNVYVARDVDFSAVLQ